MSFYGGLSKEHLKQFIQRIERLEEEKKIIAEDIASVFSEAKGGGFDVKAMREILKKRKLDASELEQQEGIVDTYKIALGMTPGDDEPKEQ